MKRTVEFHDLQDKRFKISSDKIIFRPSVYGVLFKENKILLSKQWDGYDFPGGGINIDETIEEALKREFIEETGLEVELLQPIYCQTSFFKPTHSKGHKHENWNCPLIYYLVKEVGGQISKDNLDEEEQEYADLPEWIDIKVADKLKYLNSIDSVKLIEMAWRIYNK